MFKAIKAGVKHGTNNQFGCTYAFCLFQTNLLIKAAFRKR